MEQLSAVTDGFEEGWEGQKTYGPQRNSINWGHT